MSFTKHSRWQRGAYALICVGLLASCNDKEDVMPGPPPPVTTPNVVGLTQAAAATALTGAGLMLGTVAMQGSATVPTGSVISQTPASGVLVVNGSAVNLVVSSGAVAVPNVVGLTQAAAAAALAGAGLVLGPITPASSATVPAGSVISQTPAAGTITGSGSAVSVSVSVGPAASFAYVTNIGDGTISAYSINPQGQLAPLAVSPIPVPGGAQLYETKIDPSGRFLYVVNADTPGGVFAFVIQGDGSLQALNGGAPYPAGNSPQSLAFDATGKFLYVLNVADNSISAFSLDQTGALSVLATYPIVQTNPNPQPLQMVRAGNYLYLAEYASSSVEVFAITPATGELMEGVTGSPFATDTEPYSLAVDPSGLVLYTANVGSTGSGSISAFTISSSGVLVSASALPLAIPVAEDISIDSQGHFLFVTEANGVAVYPIIISTGLLGAAVAGSPFAAGTTPYSVNVDLTDQFVYVANYGSANVSQFTLGNTGVLTPQPGSPIAAGNDPVFVAIH
ncbi:MAG: beta-propeller fold lactonase family protein [Steroidobacteraceae bacterium]